MSHTYPVLPLLTLLCFQTTSCPFLSFLVDFCPLRNGKQQRSGSLWGQSRLFHPQLFFQSLLSLLSCGWKSFSSKFTQLKQTVLQPVDYADWWVWEINKAAEMERLNKKQEEFSCAATYVEFDEFARKKKNQVHYTWPVIYIWCSQKEERSLCRP